MRNTFLARRYSQQNSSRQAYRPSGDEEQRSPGTGGISATAESSERRFEEAPPADRSGSRGGANSLVRVSAVRSLAFVRAARLQLFKMSPMAMRGSIFNHTEISAGGTAGKESE